jgi:hypothetical protein
VLCARNRKMCAWGRAQHLVRLERRAASAQARLASVADSAKCAASVVVPIKFCLQSAAQMHGCSQYDQLVCLLRCRRTLAVLLLVATSLLSMAECQQHTQLAPGSHHACVLMTSA